MQARLLRARQMAKKNEENVKYRKSGDIQMRASVFEGKIPGNKPEDKK